jgi:hypothetical protein
MSGKARKPGTFADEPPAAMASTTVRRSKEITGITEVEEITGV